MKFLLIILFFCLYFFVMNNIYYNKNMNLVFVGDCMFGRDGNEFVTDPFVNVKHILKQADFVFLNLETTISNPLLSDENKVDKVFNYQSNGDQLLSLKKYTKKPVFVSIVNNHSLDYGVQGHTNTKKFLKDNEFLYNSKQKVEHKNVIFLNATDHCGCNNEELWSKNIWMIDYNNLEPVYKRIKDIKKDKKLIVFSIHWGSNWVKGDMPDHIKSFGRKLIDYGVNIVYGHSAHHIVKNPIENYKDGIIIYGLGDFINDYAVDESFKSDEALICVIHKKWNRLEPELIKVKRKFIKSSSIPFV